MLHQRIEWQEELWIQLINKAQHLYSGEILVYCGPQWKGENQAKKAKGRRAGSLLHSTWAALPRLEGLPRGTRQSVAATASAAASGEDFPTARSTPLEYVAFKTGFTKATVKNIIDKGKIFDRGIQMRRIGEAEDCVRLSTNVVASDIHVILQVTQQSQTV